MHHQTVAETYGSLRTFHLNLEGGCLEGLYIDGMIHCALAQVIGGLQPEASGSDAFGDSKAAVEAAPLIGRSLYRSHLFISCILQRYAYGELALHVATLLVVAVGDEGEVYRVARFVGMAVGEEGEECRCLLILSIPVSGEIGISERVGSS